MFTNLGSDDVLDELQPNPPLPPPPPATESQRSQPSQALNLNFPMVGRGRGSSYTQERDPLLSVLKLKLKRYLKR